MKWGLAIATAAGLAALVALIAANDPAAIIAMIERVGWGLLLVVAVRATALAIAGVAWAKLLHKFAALHSHVYVLLRWLRESINVLLPVAQVGGDLVGARLLTFWNVPPGLAAASIMVDLALQLAGQLAFTLLGLAALAASRNDPRIAGVVGGGMAISLLALAGFYGVQRSNVTLLVERMLTYAAKQWPRYAPGALPGLHASLQSIWRSPGPVAASFGYHLLAWVLGVAEIRIALRCMGQQTGWAECIVLESIGQAVRTADFAIPGVMGVQEGGFLVIGSLYGLHPEVSLALSLVKRVPDVVLGLPGLAIWMLLERRQRRLRSSSVLNESGNAPDPLFQQTGTNQLPSRGTNPLGS